MQAGVTVPIVHKELAAEFLGDVYEERRMAMRLCYTNNVLQDRVLAAQTRLGPTGPAVNGIAKMARLHITIAQQRVVETLFSDCKEDCPLMHFNSSLRPVVRSYICIDACFDQCISRLASLH